MRHTTKERIPHAWDSSQKQRQKKTMNGKNSMSPMKPTILAEEPRRQNLKRTIMNFIKFLNEYKEDMNTIRLRPC